MTPENRFSPRGGIKDDREPPPRHIPPPQPHILVVDDDARLRGLLQRFLGDSGFAVSTAADAAEARSQLTSLLFDALVVDVMMPGENGLDLTRSLRNTVETPILMLTARSEADERIAGLESGADDYLAKPFEPRELVLRLRSILRRSAPLPSGVSTPHTIRIGESIFNLKRQELRSKGVRIHLTNAEAQLLTILSSAPGKPFSRDALADLAGITGKHRTVDVQVTRLRKKIEVDPRQPRYLRTQRGKGYLLQPG